MSQQLRALFLQAQLPTSSHRFILTYEQVNSILTPERIRSLLSDEVQLEPHLCNHYTSLTSKRAKKILAILICLGRVSYLLDHFLHRQVWDHRLPLNALDLPKSSFAELFLREQWHFLAPTIQHGTFHDWPSEVILPFELDEPIADAEGGFGIVHKIFIIPDFQRLQETALDANTKVFFARKELKTQRSRTTMVHFSRERQVLELLNLLHHPHIIPLLASYIHADRFNLVFPLADTSLESLLSGTAAIPAITHESLWKQVLGITSALDRLHNFSYNEQGVWNLEKIGYHHDLKPQNILIRNGTFLLADFGLAALKDPVLQSGTMFKNGALTYGAPETVGKSSRENSTVGRALDIWSWGCIMIEVITLELMGSVGVVQFRHDRTTSLGMNLDSFFHCNGKVKPEVELWIDVLRESAAKDRYYFERLVSNTLDLVNAMLASDWKERASSASVHWRLCEYVKHADIRISPNRTDETEREGISRRKPPPQPFLDTNIAAEDARENLEGFLGKDHPVMKALAQQLLHGDT